MPADPRRVTVVVISSNRRDELLASLPRHEGPVILVDNGSTDGTVAAVREAFPHVRVVALTRNAGAAARNVGVALAGTPYVAFADDDSWWAPGALERAAAIFDARPRLGLLAGRILVGPENRLDPVSAEMAASALGRRDGAPGPDVLGFVACGAIVRRAAFRATGGFDAVVHFPGEEERVSIDLARLGWEQCYVDQVVAHHHPSPQRSTAERRQYLIARNTLLTAVMRRPWPVVGARTARAWTAGGPTRRAIWGAARRLPQALVARRRIPADLDRRLRLLA